MDELEEPAQFVVHLVFGHLRRTVFDRLRDGAPARQR